MDYREEAIECVKDCVLPIHQQIYAKYNGDFDRIYSEGYNSKSNQGRTARVAVWTEPRPPKPAGTPLQPG